MTNAMIEAVGLHKSFGETHALSGLDFDVPEGAILGMLGPNGAGKTTAVRILTTLTHPAAARRRWPESTCCAIRRGRARRSASLASTPRSTSF
jgi:ABC-type uncharacterized transport system ATPase subunit